MQKDFFKNRRRLAITAFIALIVTLFSCLGVAFWGDAGAATRLKEVGLIIGPIILCLTGLVGQYALLVFKQDTINARKQN